MELRNLGRSDLRIAPLAFGGNVFGWTADEATSFRLLDRFVDAGFNFVDTADVYSRWHAGNHGGESEVIIGNWLKQGGKRDKVVIGTKVGMEMGPDKKGLSGAYIKRAVEDSLRRLQVDAIDLYMSHRDDPATPLAETLETYAALIKQGKVRVIGASNYTASRLAEALDVSAKGGLPRYESLQPLYSIAERGEFEGELEKLCEREQLGVISYFSLASGFLTGKYRSKADAAGRARGSHVEKYLDERGFRILEALDAVAARYGAKPSQVALAWLIARPSVTAPIASATSVEQLDEIMRAPELKLDQAAIEQIDRASR